MLSIFCCLSSVACVSSTVCSRDSASMACTCGHSPVLLPCNNASMFTRSSLSSTLRARQSKLDVRIVGSQQLVRDSTLLLKLGARSYSVPKLSISRRVNLTTCSVGNRDGETTVPDESAPQLMDVVAKRVQPYLKLTRFKWTGTWLLTLWPFCWGATLAAGNGTLPDWRIFTVLVVAALILHAAICTLNDLWDKDIDGKVERSKLRPLVTGEVTLFQGWAFFGAQTLFYLAVLSQLEVFSLSSQFQVLIAIQLILHILYPLSKRWTYWTPAVLGLAINWGVFLGWSIVRGPVDLGPPALLPALIFFAAFCWTLVYETIYAHQDIKDDRDVGVKSLPLLLGDSSKLWITGFGTAFVVSLGIVGQIAALGWPYYIGVVGAAIHVGWQIATVDLKNPSDCLAKFLSLRWVGAVVFGGIAGAKLLT